MFLNFKEIIAFIDEEDRRDGDLRLFPTMNAYRNQATILDGLSLREMHKDTNKNS